MSGQAVVYGRVEDVPRCPYSSRPHVWGVVSGEDAHTWEMVCGVCDGVARQVEPDHTACTYHLPISRVGKLLLRRYNMRVVVSCPACEATDDEYVQSQAWTPYIRRSGGRAVYTGRPCLCGCRERRVMHMQLTARDLPAMSDYPPETIDVAVETTLLGVV